MGTMSFTVADVGLCLARLAWPGLKGAQMLRHTFCHIPGIGAKTERQLWAAGLTTWSAILAQEGPQKRAGLARRLPASTVRDSITHHARANLSWFADRLPSAEHWRLFGDFRDRSAYLDIETTGLESSDRIT